MEMSLRIEVFVNDADTSLDFYRGVLGFDEETRRVGSDGRVYAAVRRGSVRIGIVTSWAEVDRGMRDLPVGTEIVLEVDDVDAELRHVRASGWPIHRDLETQEWGLADFRLFDPDGYYLRVTSRQTSV